MKRTATDTREKIIWIGVFLFLFLKNVQKLIESAFEAAESVGKPETQLFFSYA